jgi:hypothetical protein
MAARLNPRNQQSVRDKIQATQLVKRLQDEALGKIEMTDGQRDSAKFLLSRCLSPPVPRDDDGKKPEGAVLITWQP